MSPGKSWGWLILSLAISAPAHARVPKPLARIEAARGVVAVNLGSRGIRDTRLRVMRRTAYTLGVQGGAYWREQHVNALLRKESVTLDRMFNFAPLLLDAGQVQPPVIDVVEGAYRLDSDTTGESVVTTYRIEAPARLVSTAPNWRSWLITHFPPLTRVSRLLLPTTAKEQRVWKREVDRGWAAGVAEFNSVYDANLHALARDYLGMARFHLLAEQGVISVPALATGNLGIRVNGHQLEIGQRLFRLTMPARFTPSATWHPVPVPAQGDER